MAQITNHAGSQDALSAGLAEWVAPNSACPKCGKETVEDARVGWRICCDEKCREKRYVGVGPDKLDALAARAALLTATEAKLRAMGELVARHAKDAEKVLTG